MNYNKAVCLFVCFLIVTESNLSGWEVGQRNLQNRCDLVPYRLQNLYDDFFLECSVFIFWVPWCITWCMRSMRRKSHPSKYQGTWTFQTHDPYQVTPCTLHKVIFQIKLNSKNQEDQSRQLASWMDNSRKNTQAGNK